MPKLPVGLEIVALRPFVPGFDEDKAILGRTVGDRGEGVAHVAAKCLGRGPVEHDALWARAGRVVPAGDDRGVAALSQPGLGFEEQDGVLVEVHAAGPAAEPLLGAVGDEARAAGEGVPAVPDAEAILAREPGAPPALGRHLPEPSAHQFQLIGHHGTAIALGPPGEFEFVVAQLGHEVDALQPVPGGELLPLGDEAFRLGQLARPEDREDGPAIDPQVAAIGERGEQRVKVPLVIVRAGVGLLHQHPLFRPVPMAAPGVVGPGEAEGEVRLLGGDHLLEGALQEAFPGEPVMPVAEGLDAGAAGQLRLRGAGFRDAQVIEAEIGRLVRLVMLSLYQVLLKYFKETS